MDKSIFTALNSMQILKNNQSVTSQNLSNTNVPGFKKDIHANFGSLYLDREKGIDPRVYALSDVGAFDSSQGALNPTERPLDLSIDGDGFFIVNPKNGNQALSRRGDLKIDENVKHINTLLINSFPSKSRELFLSSIFKIILLESRSFSYLFFS